MMRHVCSRLVAPAFMVLQLLLGFGLLGDASAQSPAAVTDGTAFAKSIAPSSASQIVNPAGVNATAWSGSTATPTTVPSSLGTFSTPNVSTDNYTAAKAIGLAGFGNQAVMNCATYDPSTGDPTQTQTCAAVNFLSNRCLTPTTQQSAVMAANATSLGPVTADCTGTYGQAQANFGYSEAESSADAIFGVVAGLPSQAGTATGETCTTQTVVVTPAQYAINTCSKNASADEYTCYQYLNTSIKTEYTPATPTDSCTAPAVLQDGFCVASSSSPAPVIYGCPPDETLVGNTCTSTSTNPANPTYSCPPGFVLDGSTCTQTSTAPGTPGTSCPTDVGNPDVWFARLFTGSFMGHSAWCEYADSNVLNPLAPLDECKKLIPSPPDGMQVFFGTNSVPAHNNPYNTTTCDLTVPEVCPTGYNWNGSVCQEVNSQAATITGYNCPTGVLTGDQCVVTTSNPADPTYQCPTGTVLDGTNCVSTTSNPPNVSYSCPDGSAPVGDQCITSYVLTSWVDTCGPYEDSAGSTLPTPP